MEIPFKKGYTPIPNILSKVRLSGRETQCLLVIMRKTWGEQKEKSPIALSSFALSTGIKHQHHISKILSGLLRKNIILKNDSDFPIVYGIQTDFDKWKPLTRKITTKKTKIKTIHKKKFCSLCGFDKVTEEHHIIPLSKGGNDTKENKIVLCPNCHRLVHKGKISMEELLICKKNAKN